MSNYSATKGLSTTERLLRESSTARRRNRSKQLIAKDGSSLVENERVQNKVLLYLKDVFTTFIRLKWAPLILACYIVTWIAFALLWWAASATYTPEGGPCIIRVTNFTSAFLFSVETQTTIDFGDLYVASGCSLGIFLLESVSGVILITRLLHISAFVIGILFTKLARPRLRGRTVLFSASAVVWRNPKTDRFYLQCRVGDVRKSHILEAHVRAIVFRFTKGNSDTGSDVAIETNFQTSRRRRRTKIDKFLFASRALNLTSATIRVSIGFFSFPSSFSTKLTNRARSTTWGPRDLATARIEVLFNNLEGTLEATGMLTQKLRSYLPEEILGIFIRTARFRVQGVPMADFSRLSDVVRDQTMPRCSPKAYYERQSQTKP